MENKKCENCIIIVRPDSGTQGMVESELLRCKFCPECGHKIEVKNENIY